MISWMPLLGRNGAGQPALVGMGLVDQPLEWLLFSDFSVVLAFVHLYTMFMIVPIFNSHDAHRPLAARGRQRRRRVRLADAVERDRAAVAPGILIGSIFVITIVMGDFVTIGVMGGRRSPRSARSS